MSVSLEPIGTIYTPFEKKEGMPIQPKGAEGIKGRIVLYEEFAPGLADLDGFSHIILIYQFNKSEGFKLKVVPFLDNTPRGVFATRAPRRPNPIGLSVVRLTGINNNILDIENVDMLNETPLLDIKPYIPEFDFIELVRTGWAEKNITKLDNTRSDKRFK